MFPMKEYHSRSPCQIKGDPLQKDADEYEFVLMSFLRMTSS